MDKIIVQGGRRLHGEVTVSGSKNAALPILISSLLTAEPCLYQGIPHLADIHTTLKLLGGLGCEVDKEAWARGIGDLTLRADACEKLEASYDLVKTMRASFLVTGPLLARFGRAHVSTPGGCAIGTRPVNLHLKGLAAMGASYRSSPTVMWKQPRPVARRENLSGSAFRRRNGKSHDGRIVAEGTTVIENAAKEPEIEDLAEALNKMGARYRAPAATSSGLKESLHCAE